MGAEGLKAMSFRVDCSGRVLDHVLLSSSGYADLDAGIDEMMHGTQLPPGEDPVQPDAVVANSLRRSLI
jgi:hypothetical protein